MLIKGTNLSERQLAHVKNAFGYRWTVENNNRERWWYGISGKPTMPLQSDAQWIADHAFHFLANGSRLMANRLHAEPVYLAD